MALLDDSEREVNVKVKLYAPEDFGIDIDIEKEITVNIRKAKIQIESASISYSPEVMEGEVAEFYASIYPFDANQKLTWEVEGGEAEVVVRGDHNEDAAITFYYSGNYTITIKNSDGSELDSKNVYVGAKSGGDDPWF